MLDLATSRNELNVIADHYGTPTHAELIADATANVLRCCICKSNAHNLSGTYHLTADGKTNWFSYARLVLETAEDLGVVLKVKPSEIKPISSEEYQVAAIRPKKSILDCKKIQRTFGIFLPSWRCHLYRTVKELVEKGMANE
jgi:dTDP-4-dehydrorhamnose reductase